MSELMHAIVLLAHFHSLASFVFGCGVTSETDHPDGHVYAAKSDECDRVAAAAAVGENNTAMNGHAPSVAAEVGVRSVVCRLFGICTFGQIIPVQFRLVVLSRDSTEL